MTITPMEIHNKEFPKSFRGYNEDEVDQFLDRIVEEFEKIYKENQDYKEKINLLGEQLSYYKTIENTLKETLVTAQKTADEVIDSAKKKAEVIIEEAGMQAKKIIENANNEVFEINKDYEEAKRHSKIFKNRMKNLLETQLSALEEDIQPPDESHNS